MRAFAFCLAASLTVAAVWPGGAKAAPARVVSLNLCTDELLLLLAEPGQIASVTHLSQQQGETPLWRQARRYRRNDGSLMSVAALRPDLVLTMGGGARDRIGIARRLGASTVDLPFPQRIEDIEAAIRTVATALGRPAAGRAWIERLRQLRRTAPSRVSDAVWLGGGGQSVSPTGLEAQWMRLAGLGQRALPGERMTLEQLLIRPPTVLLRSDYRHREYSAAQAWLQHPIARRARRSRTLVTDGRRWTCMGPLLIEEIERLRRELSR